MRCDNYLCYMMRCCQGSPREDVIEYLEDRYPHLDLNKLSSSELNEKLVDQFDVDYRGPSHVNADQEDAEYYRIKLEG